VTTSPSPNPGKMRSFFPTPDRQSLSSLNPLDPYSSSESVLVPFLESIQKSNPISPDPRSPLGSTQGVYPISSPSHVSLWTRPSSSLPPPFPPLNWAYEIASFCVTGPSPLVTINLPKLIPRSTSLCAPRHLVGHLEFSPLCIDSLTFFDPYGPK